MAAQKEIIQIEAASSKAAKLVKLGEKLANSERFHLFSRLYDSYEYQQFAILLVSIVRNRESDDSLILEEFLNRKKTSKKSNVVESWLLQLIEAVVCAFRSRWPESVNLFTEALLTYSDPKTSLSHLFAIVHTQWIRDGLVSASLNSPSTNDLLFGVFNGINRPPTELKYEDNLMATPTLTILRKSDKVMWKRFGGENNRPEEAIYYYIDLANASNSYTSMIALYSSALLWTIHVLKSGKKTRAEFFAYRMLLRKLCMIIYVLADRDAPASRIYAYRIICSAIVIAARLSKPLWSKSDKTLMSQDEIDVLDACINAFHGLSSIMPLVSIPASLSYDVVYTVVMSQKAFNFSLNYLLENDKDILANDLSLISRNSVNYFVFEGRLREWFSKPDDIKEDDEDEDEKDRSGNDDEDKSSEMAENLPIDSGNLPKSISEFYTQESRLICIMKTIYANVSI